VHLLYLKLMEVHYYQKYKAQAKQRINRNRNWQKKSRFSYRKLQCSKRIYQRNNTWEIGS